MQQGLLVIEDLGSEGVVAGDPPAPIVERYETAVDALLLLHGRQLPAVLPVAPHVEHEIPPYDMDAFLIEVELLLEWYLPRLGIVVTDDARADFFGYWRDALAPVLDAPPNWVLRDFHSPNLLWLPERKEIARLGVLDFQDAVMGPPAYDLASLLNDSLFPPAALEDELVAALHPGEQGALDYRRAVVQRAVKAVGNYADFARRGFDRHLKLVAPTLARAWRWFGEVPELRAVRTALRPAWEAQLDGLLD